MSNEEIKTEGAPTPVVPPAAVPDAKAIRDRAKLLAEERRAERKNRKRKCTLCGVEENDKVPFVAHPDGIGPSCKEPSMCEHYRASRAAGR